MSTFSLVLSRGAVIKIGKATISNPSSTDEWGYRTSILPVIFYAELSPTQVTALSMQANHTHSRYVHSSVFDHLASINTLVTDILAAPSKSQAANPIAKGILERGRHNISPQDLVAHIRNSTQSLPATLNESIGPSARSMSNDSSSESSSSSSSSSQTKRSSKKPGKNDDGEAKSTQDHAICSIYVNLYRVFAKFSNYEYCAYGQKAIRAKAYKKDSSIAQPGLSLNHADLFPPIDLFGKSPDSEDIRQWYSSDPNMLSEATAIHYSNTVSGWSILHLDSIKQTEGENKGFLKITRDFLTTHLKTNSLSTQTGWCQGLLDFVLLRCHFTCRTKPPTYFTQTGVKEVAIIELIALYWAFRTVVG